MCKIGFYAFRIISRNSKYFFYKTQTFQVNKHIIEDNRAKAVNAGIIDVILNAMKTHIDNGDVWKFGCDALYVIAKDGKFFYIKIHSTRMK